MSKLIIKVVVLALLEFMGLFDHFGCMVDLFSWAGLLQEASEFISNPMGLCGELFLVDAEFTKMLNWLKKQSNTFGNWIH